MPPFHRMNYKSDNPIQRAILKNNIKQRRLKGEFKSWKMKNALPNM